MGSTAVWHTHFCLLLLRSTRRFLDASTQVSDETNACTPVFWGGAPTPHEIKIVGAIEKRPSILCTAEDRCPRSRKCSYGVVVANSNDAAVKLLFPRG